VEKFEDMCFHLDTIPQRDGRTDGWTDRQKWRNNIALSLCMCACCECWYATKI